MVRLRGAGGEIDRSAFGCCCCSNREMEAAFTVKSAWPAGVSNKTSIALICCDARAPYAVESRPDPTDGAIERPRRQQTRRDDDA